MNEYPPPPPPPPPPGGVGTGGKSRTKTVCTLHVLGVAVGPKIKADTKACGKSRTAAMMVSALNRFPLGFFIVVAGQDVARTPL